MDIETKRQRIAARLRRSSSAASDVNPSPRATSSGSAPPAAPIAVIGLSGYWPKCASVDELWRAVDDDAPLLETIPKSRFDWTRLYDPTGEDPSKMHTKWGGFLPDVAGFDAAFFGVVGHEADRMDPRQRLLLMSAYHTLEDAGYAPSSLGGSSTGVFVGAEHNEYLQILRERGAPVGDGLMHAEGMLANRISHHFDLRGPSEVVNTMCSSAAVALHRAVTSLRAGEVQLALVGAANLILRPDLLVALSSLRQMSPEPTVRSFGRGARGYLRGEGVASVLLKPLARAEADGDPIYAVIRNTAVNYNGRGGASIAAPDIASHADVIAACYLGAGVDVGDVGYIEAQGMGIPLSDIAEWEACNRALERCAEARGATLRPGQCRIGTLKPMTGHMHAASALGALFKVIRSFQTKLIHRVRGFEAMNPDLSTEGRPCAIAAATEPWESWGGKRLAGVHSYGSGGNNAHVLLEEYREAPRRASETASPSLFPVSARTPGQLRQRVEDLVQAIERHPEHAIEAISATLQVGRDEMQHRVAFVAADRETLLRQARAYASGGCLEGLVRGDAPPESGGEQSRAALAARTWARGGQLTTTATPGRRLHLPGYPFEMKGHWIAEPAGAGRAIRADDSGGGHPLLGWNCSDLERTRFRTRFTESDGLIADHRLGDDVVFPGVSYLEMACAATRAATHRPATRVTGVVWQSEMRLARKPALVEIALSREGQDDVRYEVGAVDAASDAVSETFGSGVVSTASLPAQPAADLAAIRAQCARRAGIDGFYAQLREMGLHYGPRFRLLRSLSIGEGQLLARVCSEQITEDAGPRDGAEARSWDPARMDAALHACLAFGLRWKGDDLSVPEDAAGDSWVPFSLAEVHFHAPLPPDFEVHGRLVGAAGGPILRVDADLVGDEGKILVAVRGLSFRRRPTSSVPLAKSASLFRPHWEDATLGPASPADDHGVVVAMPASLLGATQEALAASRPFCGPLSWHAIDEGGDTPSAIAMRNVVALTSWIKSLAQSRKRQSLLFCVPRRDAWLHGYLPGLARAVARDVPSLACRVVYGPDAGGPWSDVVRAEASHPVGAIHIDWSEGQRRALRFVEINEDGALEKPASAIESGKTYWITGGLGGIGRVLARSLSKIRGVRLVLSGRSPASDATAAYLESLGGEAAALEYIPADLSDLASTRACFETIRSRHGGLSGVLHGAGVFVPGTIFAKREPGMMKTLRPKIEGALHLDEVTRLEELDFMVYFSSLASILGHHGHWDYAAANGYLDELAAHRNELVRAGRRHGRTLAINWPNWAGGGMTVDAATLRLWQGWGLAPMGDDLGADTLTRCLSVGGVEQVVVAAGDREKYRELIAGANHPARDRQPGPEREPRAGDVPVDGARTAAEATVRGLLGEFLQVAPGEVDLDAELSDQGFDSLLVVELSRKIQARHGIRLDPAIVFEHTTPRKLADYLAEHHRSELSGPAPASPAVAGRAERAVSAARRVEETPAGGERARERSPDSADFIAVIGLAGRYPKAPDLDVFWNNLRDGRDCVEEVPAERWPWRAYYLPGAEAAAQTGKHSGKWGGFLEDLYLFDPLFFRMSPDEARGINPKERVFCQCAWHALEDAGYTRRALAAERVGVFVGVSKAGVDPYSDSFSGIANRVSYSFDFHGPSMAIDTMCSSSLVAVHVACQLLRAGDCTLALVGGVNAYLHPSHFGVFTKNRVLAADGRTKAFAADGDGMVPGEGVGALLLKPLQRALRDGDSIHGVLRGTAANHGGKTNGYTVPNPKAQSEMIRLAMQRASVRARQVTYVEAHGTGTRLGDPVEVRGLTLAFREDTQDRGFCRIGSVKTNIGHLEAAAGVAGLTKVLLQMRHRQLAPSLHATRVDPELGLPATPFNVQTRLEPWEPGDASGAPMARTACVSSFGAGGSNAHVVVQEWPERESAAARDDEMPVVIVLSARAREALESGARRLLRFCDASEVPALVDVAYTLQIGREEMEERLGFVVRSTAEIKEELRRFLNGLPLARGARGRAERRPDPEARQLETSSARGEGDVEAALEHLVRVWVSGAPVDWHALYPGRTPRRERLPGYAFAQQYYGPPHTDGAEAAQPTGARSDAELPDPAIRAAAAPQASSFRAREGDARPETAHREHASSAEGRVEQTPHAIMHFTEAWQERTRTELASRSPARVVCFASTTAARRGLTEAVRSRSPGTELVFVGDGRLDEVAPGDYRARPDDEASFREVVARIRRERGEADVFLFLWPLEDSRWAEDASVVFHLVAALAAAGSAPRTLLLAARCATPLQRCHVESWIGFERSAAWALPDTRLSIVFEDTAFEQDGEAPFQAALWVERLWGELAGPGASVLYRRGVRHVLELREAATEPAPAPSAKTFVITGGLGGIGYVVARHLARTRGARLVLVGRSVLSAEGEARVRALHELGGEAMYVSADVCDPVGLAVGIRRAKERFGAIHGVVHAAGIAGGLGLAGRTREDFLRVLAPKMEGTIVLDETLAREPLELVCYFSSAAAILGDFGSCDYAVANRFQLAHAAYRNELRRLGLRSGKTTAIAWPVWRHGGMHVSQPEDTDRYLKSSGQTYLEDHEGCRIFDELAGREETPHLVLAGDRTRARSMLASLLGGGADPRPNEAPGGSAQPSGSNGAEEKPRGGDEESATSPVDFVRRMLTEVVSAQLAVPAERVHPATDLSDFGYESISFVKLAQLLSRTFDVPVTPALFFAHSTIEQLTAHFVGKHAERIQALWEAESGSRRPAADAPEPRSEEPARTPETRDPWLTTPSASDEPIAIVGLSGRFPQARNIEEMWRILAGGKEVVEEIPSDRFDWRRYYGDPASAPRKTNCKWSGIVPGVREFDPLFFEISPREAEMMDPRHRLLLQEAWNALEDAAYGPRQIRRDRIGIFVGAEEGDYHRLEVEESVTSSHTAVLATRLAYFLDLHGPAMILNTACSSGLVAAHQACLSLRNRECDAAIVGSAHLMLAPDIFIRMARAGMSSVDGHTYTFDTRANGIVPGEAVVAMLLKPLSRALSDGDPIRGVIRGHGINCDGKTQGITAPNGAAQADLLRGVYRRFGIDPRAIEHVVAHGTGTRLGDPVEVNALREAFESAAPAHGSGVDRRAFCALTSCKPNFGHTSAASGLVSIAALLQGFRHEAIPPSLNCVQESEYIDWKKGPFYVNKALRAWPERAGEARLGAVSAFGISGTNAHLVLQSPERAEAVRHEAPCHLLVLSAKSEQALARKIADMVCFLRSRPEHDLAAIAYTLLDGRHSFRWRCAVVARDVEEAILAWTEGGDERGRPTLFRGTIEQGFEPQSALTRCVRELLAEAEIRRDDATRYRESLLAVAELYCQGYDVEAGALYGRVVPKRVSLPGYPFATDAYWAATAAPAPDGRRDRLHPLVHENTSELSVLRFTSCFDGNESFFADHVIRGKKLLPAVAMLEMARAAVIRALASSRRESVAVSLRNVGWAQPLPAAGGRTTVHVELQMRAEGEIAFEIRSGGEHGPTVVHSQGVAVVHPPSEAPRVSLAELRAAAPLRTMDGAACYEIFRRMGMVYGRSLQSLQSVTVAKHGVLARIVVPPAASGTEADFVLHPSLLDGALQATVGLMAEAPAVYLPFALGNLEVFGPIGPAMWAWIRRSEGAGEGQLTLDIDGCDDEGRLCVRLKALASRAAEKAGAAEGAPPREVLLFRPAWRPRPAAPLAGDRRFAARVVVLCEVDGFGADELASRLDSARCLRLPRRDGSIAERYLAHAVDVHDEVRRILAGRPESPVLMQLVVPDDGERRVLRGLAAILKTAEQENPAFIGQVLAFDQDVDLDECTARLRASSGDLDAGQVRYAEGQRLALSWEETTPLPQPPMPWSARGVYLITGGLGGIGRLLAEEILRTSTSPKVILAGRSGLTGEREAELSRLRALAGAGARVEYRRADVGDGEAAASLVRSIVDEFSGLNGVLHCAGVLRDGFLLGKTAAEYREVLASKVAGTAALDRATKDLPLDFFVLFSSTSSVIGNVGQADYAAANAFMDGFAAHRQALVDAGQRRGKTLSIDWPLWSEGRMSVAPELEQAVRARTGMTAMSTRQGMKALGEAFGMPESQVMVLAGDAARLRALLSPPRVDRPAALHEVRAEREPEAAHGAAAVQDGDGRAVRASVFEQLRALLASELKLPASQVEERAPMSVYGIDSIVVMKLTSRLETVFGSLSKTLFFEYQTLGELADYFVKRHRAKLASFIGGDPGPSRATPPAPPEADNRAEPPPAAQAAADEAEAERTPIGLPATDLGNAPVDGIAIVGLAGRYPQALDLDAYWANLRAGRDCITEVPASRWDIRDYYREDGPKPGHHDSKWGGFIDDVDKFDALFFRISPKEATLMDPQERLFLEHAWMALEDAGYRREDLQRPGEHGATRQVGVYAGVMYGEYQLLGAEASLLGERKGFANTLGSIANRVSYVFNLNGPSITLDTMCSSSLTCLHLACQDLRSGRVHMAIAGGVNLSIHPNKYLMLSAGQFLSNSGRCESFGEGGEGYIPAEGVGVAILKRLSDAERDGDHIYGVIRGSAINHGGQTNGYTVPNPNAQAAVIAEALRDARLPARAVGYVEAHGTGTKLGDPIEMTGLNKVFGDRRSDSDVCWLGSVKSNIGHCEAAAGIAALTKVVLQMRGGEIVPSLHSERLNPHIDFSATRLRVNQSLRAWDRPVVDGKELPRVAGISSFGAGGSNAHLVLEEHRTGPERADAAARRGEPGRGFAIVVSAKDDARLREYAEKLLRFLERGGDGVDLSALSYTLQVGREPMEERLGMCVESVEALVRGLQCFLRGDEGPPVRIFRGRAERDRDRLRKELFGSLDREEHSEYLLERWLEERRYAKLLWAWSRGVDVDWQRLYPDERPPRLSLPTYPFERRRCWVEVARPDAGPRRPSALVAAPAPPLASAPSARAPEAARADTWTLTPVWRPFRTPVHTVAPRRAPGSVLIVGGTSIEQEWMKRIHPDARTMSIDPGATASRLTAELAPFGPLDSVVWIAPAHDLASLSDEGVIDAQRQGVLHAFKLVKALISTSEPRDRPTITFVTTQTQQVLKGESVNPTHAGVHGLAGSLVRERPDWQIRILDMELGREWPVEAMFALPASTDGSALAHRGQGWYRRQLLPVRSSPRENPAYRRGGVYVVIGGAGGIGQAWSRWMIENHDSQMVWIGRRPLDVSIQAKIDALAKLGRAPAYIAADAADRMALERACAEAKQRFSRVDGVVHSAIVLADGALANLREEEFTAVLRTKVDICVRIAQVFGDGARAGAEGGGLDFVLLFSSITSFTTPPGQGNYAAGCTFKDAFGRALGARCGFPVKIMNWGYWGTLGIVANDEIRSRMERAGIGSIEPAEGMDALDALMAGPSDQVVLVKTLTPDGLAAITGERLLQHPASHESVMAGVRQRMARGASSPLNGAALRRSFQ